MTVYRSPRYHYPRTDGSACPSPEACAHTTEFPAESCECCGYVNPGAIGNTAEAAAYLGTDLAGVFELVARGHLVATRDSDDEPWLISYAPTNPDT